MDEDRIKHARVGMTECVNVEVFIREFVKEQFHLDSSFAQRFCILETIGYHEYKVLDKLTDMTSHAELLLRPIKRRVELHTPNQRTVQMDFPTTDPVFSLNEYGETNHKIVYSKDGESFVLVPDLPLIVQGWDGEPLYLLPEVIPLDEDLIRTAYELHILPLDPLNNHLPESEKERIIGVRFRTDGGIVLVNAFEVVIHGTEIQRISLDRISSVDIKNHFVVIEAVDQTTPISFRVDRPLIFSHAMSDALIAFNS